MSDRPYFRVYYVDLERDYPDIWRDDAALAAFIRLGAVAEAMWPVLAELPRSARPSAVRRLTEASLLIAVPPYAFRIKGMDAERNARRIAGRKGAAGRWANGHALPNRAKPNPNQGSTAEPSLESGWPPPSAEEPWG